MKTLAGKVALVTGASRGLGEAIANALAKEGAIVAGTATSSVGADKITQNFKDNNLEGRGFVMDITDSSSVENALSEIQNAYGAPLILVNNAGVRQDNLFLRMSEDEWQTVINTNLNATFKLTKLCLKPMLKERWGRIISMSSVAALMGNPGQANYAAAKAGVIGMMRALALEIASRNITVNVVAPGLIDTDMTRSLTDDQKKALLDRVPMQRLGNAEEVAHTVAFLASPLASYITGEVISVNGGLYIS